VTPATHSVEVRLARRGYQIEIGTGLLDRLGSVVSQLRPTTHAAIVTDEHVHSPHAERAARSLHGAHIKVDVLVVPAGESSKCVQVAAQLWNKLLALGVDRQTLIVAVGGGVVGDLAGFVAATFARGLDFFQVPTTLLAQVDSAVGGKVGINLPAAKNMVGAFWQPLGVLADTATLATLGDREYRAGLAEVVKYGVILDAEFFAWLEQHTAELVARDPQALIHVVTRSCQLKAEVVAADEFETSGRRAVLNYGHTVAHALEATAGYGALLHGEAVSIGMMAAARLAARLGRWGADDVERQRQLLVALGLPVELSGPADADRLLAAMAHDKKVEHGRIRWVLPTRIGQVELVGGIAPPDVRAVLLSG